jgi:hypothetical protein
MRPVSVGRRGILGGLLILALIFGAAGCGGGDDSGGGKTFDDERFAFTFTYPDEFRPARLGSAAASLGEAEATEVVALDSDNLILVEKYALNDEVTPENFEAALGEVEEAVSKLTGMQVSGSETEVGGFPGVRFDDVTTPSPPNGKSRLVYLFDGRTEFAINCQSTPEKRAEVLAACDEVLGSLEPR